MFVSGFPSLSLFSPHTHNSKQLHFLLPCRFSSLSFPFTLSICLFLSVHVSFSPALTGSGTLSRPQLNLSAIHVPSTPALSIHLPTSPPPPVLFPITACVCAPVWVSACPSGRWGGRKSRQVEHSWEESRCWEERVSVVQVLGFSIWALKSRRLHKLYQEGRK